MAAVGRSARRLRESPGRGRSGSCRGSALVGGKLVTTHPKTITQKLGCVGSDRDLLEKRGARLQRGVPGSFSGSASSTELRDVGDEALEA